jgi:two-component system, OmpR family, response regulator
MNATPLRILIVEDHDDNARMLKVLLKTEGHEAGIVHDGPAAIAAANLQKPDVVLLDLSLPGMSGIEVAAELRRDPERSRCVLVAVTGHGKDSLPSPSPFDGYFVKPLDFASLLAYLSEIRAGQEPPSWTSAVA